MRNYIALAIPFFFLLIGVELWVARGRGLRVYRFNDAVVDLSCGISQQVLLVFGAGVLGAGYAWLYAHRLYSFAPSSPWPWVVAFLAVDLVYYVWHRLSHRVNFLWAVHAVHHQSEDYNLAVALRQAVLSVWTIWPFHLPLALVGVPPVAFATVESFSTLYQFWIHTELVGKLGFFERLFNTPSQHRVHHAVNPRYLDRNYAATLCIWDRLFGTFQEEVEPPVFGLVKPLRSFNPIWAQVHSWVDLWRLAQQAPRRPDKLRVWIESPPWRPHGLPPAPPPPEVSPASVRKYDPRLSPALSAYVAVNLVLSVVATFLLLLFQHDLPLARQTALAGLVLLTLLGWGGLLERRRWALCVELGRLSLAAALAVLWLREQPLLGALAAVASVLLALWLLRARAAPGAVSQSRVDTIGV